MTPEGWTVTAAWVQAIGSVAAIAGTAWAVQRSHSLQLRAERQREFRQLAIEYQSLERLFAETFVQVQVAHARRQEGSPEGSGLPDEVAIDQAMSLVQVAIGNKPHLAGLFVRGSYAAKEAIRLVNKIRLSGFQTMHPILKDHLEVLESVAQELRDSREAYEQLAEKPDDE